MRLFGATDPWPHRQPHQGLEYAYAMQLNARRFHGVTMLPSYAAERARARDVAKQAEALLAKVEACLIALPCPHAMVLRAVFTPRLWPTHVEQVFLRG